MPARDTSRYSVSTGGQLKYIKYYKIGVIDAEHGQSRTFTGFEAGGIVHIDLFNIGEHSIFIAFDSSSEAIDTDDSDTYNLELSGGIPFSNISLDGNADKISFRCKSGETSALRMVVW
jgi:hypothetical protein